MYTNIVYDLSIFYAIMQYSNELRGGTLFSFDKFEYDPKKSASNKVKHGIDFEEAKALWDDFICIIPLGSGHGEERQAVLGMIDGKHWTAVVTMREGFIRIISVRRSRKNEEAYYDGEKNDQC